MAYEVIASYPLYMPSYFLGTFTEYPFLNDTLLTMKQRNKGNLLAKVLEFTLLCRRGR